MNLEMRPGKLYLIQCRWDGQRLTFRINGGRWRIADKEQGL